MRSPFPAVVAISILCSAGLAHATPAHHTIDKIEKTATGAKIHLLMHSQPGYTRYSVGVTAHGGSRTSQQQLAKSGQAASTGAVTLEIPYGASYKAGDQLRVISSWPTQGRVHYWGQDAASIVKLP